MSPATRRPPQRTCVGCRSTRPKGELVRLVVDAAAGGVAVDRRGRAPGRGAYLCLTSADACLEAARRRRVLARALRTTPDQVDVSRLAAALAALRSGTAHPEVSSSPR